MTDEERQIAWADGYRQALRDVQTMGRHRLMTLWDDLLADMSEDATTIRRSAERARQIKKLRA